MKIVKQPNAVLAAMESNSDLIKVKDILTNAGYNVQYRCLRDYYPSIVITCDYEDMPDIVSVSQNNGDSWTFNVVVTFPEFTSVDPFAGSLQDVIKEWEFIGEAIDLLNAAELHI